MSERKLEGNFAKDREIHGESIVWSTAYRQKKSYELHADVGIEENNGSASWLLQAMCVVMCWEWRMVMS